VIVGTGGMRLPRRATAKRTGTRMTMVGDPTGMRLELIENKDAATGVARSLNVAFGQSDVDGAVTSLLDRAGNASAGNRS
jgi:CTP:molybdopterin cytidylyltransferase MocA